MYTREHYGHLETTLWWRLYVTSKNKNASVNRCLMSWGDPLCLRFLSTVYLPPIIHNRQHIEEKVAQQPWLWAKIQRKNGSRVNGYLAERLLGIYCTHHQALRKIELPRVHFIPESVARYKKQAVNPPDTIWPPSWWPWIEIAAMIT